MRNDNYTDALVEEARTWKGTPYRKRGRTKGSAADCLFIEEVMRTVLKYTGFHTGYSMMPRDRQIEAVLEAEMNLVICAGQRPIRFDHMRKGRLALFNGADPNEPQHMGMIADHPALPDVRTIIHAYGSETTGGRVIEHTICSKATFRHGGEVRSMLGGLWKIYEAKGVNDGP